MSDLRETVAAELAGRDIYSRLSQEFRNPYRHRAEAAIAAFAEAILSPEVVEAAARRMHADGAFGSSVWSADGMGERQLLEGPRVLGEDERQAWIARAKSALQAALAAAKMKEGEQEDCGCTSIDYGWYGNDGGIVSVIQCSDEGCPRANKGTEGARDG